jgi:hypothetical protein
MWLTSLSGCLMGMIKYSKKMNVFNDLSFYPLTLQPYHNFRFYGGKPRYIRTDPRLLPKQRTSFLAPLVLRQAFGGQGIVAEIL